MHTHLPMCTQACSVGCTYFLKGFPDYYVGDKDIKKGVSNKMSMHVLLFTHMYIMHGIVMLRCCVAKNKNSCSGVVSAQSFGVVVLRKPPSAVCVITSVNCIGSAAPLRISFTPTHTRTYSPTHSLTGSEACRQGPLTRPNRLLGRARQT